MSGTTTYIQNRSQAFAKHGDTKHHRGYKPCAKHGRKRLVTRKKVLVIPYYVLANGTQHMVLVQDSKTKEWGFISGGVKANEDPMQAATRELLEESSSTISFPARYDYFQFVSLYRPDDLKEIDYQRNEIVRSVYTVFTFKICDKDLVRMKCFVPNREVVQIASGEYSDFDNTWVFCDEVFNNYIRDRSQ